MQEAQLFGIRDELWGMWVDTLSIKPSHLKRLIVNEKLSVFIPHPY